MAELELLPWEGRQMAVDRNVREVEYCRGVRGLITIWLPGWVTDRRATQNEKTPIGHNSPK